MTVQLDIQIVQGQRWVQLFEVSGLTSSGFGQRLHIRDHHGATLLRAALTHDGATNARVSLTTGGILANLGATVSTAWDLQGQPVRRWVYSIEHYSLSDPDDVTVTHAGTAIVVANPTDESSITAVAPFPSYDLACLRFDIEQTLTEPQKMRLRANAGIGDGGAVVSWGGIGGTLADQTDLVTALALRATVASPTFTGTPAAPTAVGGTSTTQIATTAFAVGEVTNHAAANDPHPGYLRNLAIDGTASLLATVSSDGESLGRSAYTAATLITAAAAAAPVQSVAGRNGAVVIAVADVSGAEATANKAQPSGYASLDSDGKVPQAQLPAIAITEYLGAAANQAAMLALSGQKGDWCTRTDTGAVWIITGTDPTLLGSWTSITYPASPVTSVAGRTGAVTFSASDITDSTSAGRALLTAADAAAQRTAMGLGGAAVLAVGTTAGTVAAGDDSRLSDARTPTAHDQGSDTITSTLLDITGTTHTAAAGDDGKIYRFTHASGCAVTIPDTLAAGWSVGWVQVGNAQSTFAGSGSMVLANRQTHTKTAGQYASGGLLVQATNSVYLLGDTGA